MNHDHSNGKASTGGTEGSASTRKQGSEAASNLPILYSFRRCPYAMRARLALAISNTEVEHREVELRNRPAALYAASPKGTVPVLVLPGGAVIDESLGIMDWALGNHDPGLWLPQNDTEREVSERLTAHCDGDFKFHLDRYKYANRYADREDAENPIEHRAKASLLLRQLEEHLMSSTFILGGRQTQVDVAIAPFVRQFAFADRGWFDAQPWAHLLRWLDAFTDSALFASVMHKHAVWSKE